MAGISAYLEKALLDYSLNAGAVTRPTTWAVGLSLGAPSSTSGSEIATGSGMTRQLVTFAAATSPPGSASNSNAMTFGPINAAGTISAIQIWDTSAATIGNMLYYCPLSVARTLGSGDSLVIAAGALVISLA